jgi:hypothetical protein
LLAAVRDEHSNASYLSKDDYRAAQRYFLYLIYKQAEFRPRPGNEGHFEALINGSTEYNFGEIRSVLFDGIPETNKLLLK